MPFYANKDSGLYCEWIKTSESKCFLGALIFVLEVVLTFFKYWGKDYAFSVSDHFWFILLDQIAKVVRCKHKCPIRFMCRTGRARRPPMSTETPFRELSLPAPILRAVEELGYELASPDEARERLTLKGGDRVGF